MGQPIQTRLKVLFTASQKDVTESLAPDLLSFTYTDKETDEADEISLTLKDPDGKWAAGWKPEGGEIVEAYIYGGTVEEKKSSLFCGKFYVDSQKVSGSPRVFEIGAVSIPLNKPIRRKIKSRAWEKSDLKKIAGAIAEEGGLALLFDSEVNPSFDRQDQQRESDLKFLGRLCQDSGLSIKVTDSKLVIFDQAAYEKKTPVKTLTLGNSQILSWNFEAATSETYKSVTVSYRNPAKKTKGSAGGYTLDVHGHLVAKKKGGNPAVMEYTYTDPEADENGQEYALKKRAANVEDAKRLAKAKLRELNRRAVTGSITLIGDPGLVAGVVVTCKGFGSFDGNFIVEQAAHSISAGYTTALTLRRVNTNF